MAKRRTRKQKQQAQHQFSIDWTKLTSDPQSASSGRVVKGEIKSSLKSGTTGNKSAKKARESAVLADSSRLRYEVIRSLSLAGLILCLELVIYWVTK